MKGGSLPQSVTETVLSLLENLHLGHGFRKYFRIDAALDETLHDDVYRIRHEVYCEDLGFEPIREDRRETDEHDAHSVHCLLRTVDPAHRPVGCARVVMANPADRSIPLPFERACAHALDRTIIDPAKLPRERIAEVSRLAVRKAYRRRKGEERLSASDVRDEDFGTAEQPRFPYIPVSLYMGTIAIAARHGVDTLFVLTEPRLAAHFAKLGVRITRIGGPIEHRGTRIPSMIDVQDVIANMRTLMKPLWREVLAEIDRSYESQQR